MNLSSTGNSIMFNNIHLLTIKLYTRTPLLILLSMFCKTSLGEPSATDHGAIVSSRLHQLVNETAAPSQPGPVALKDSFVDIIVEVPAHSRIDAVTRSHGSSILYRVDNKHQLRVPRSRLEALLADMPQGVFARLPYPHTENAVTSQGVALTGADTMQSLNTNGLNVKIGVIDLGFASLASSQASGDLPASLSIVDYTATGTGGSSHGTNVAQIVHDMAPAAELYLAKIGTDVELQIAVNDMIANGVQVINHSVAWFGAAFYDGTGPICDITTTAENADIVWVNAAGNSRNDHFLGTFNDSNGNLFHEFAAGQDYNTLSATAGVPYSIVLNWDDYITQSKVDYDLYIYDGDPTAGGVILAQSTNAQFASYPLPHEILTVTPPATATHYIVVKKRNAATADLPLTLFTLGKTLSVGTLSTSMPQPADCASVFAVGATDLNDAPEWFSSEGPTTDGRNKPEVSAPDRVITSLTSSFAGTSASSPHVAGAAALLIQQNPGLDASGVKNLLISDSHDVHTAAFDLRTGHGRISLDADQDGVNHDTDNCIVVYNSEQADSDSNGTGDACEAPRITGFWPGAAAAGDFIFVFGKYLSGNLSLSINGINTTLVQAVSDDMLIFILPEGDTNGPISISNEHGTAVSANDFGQPLSGLQITGIWPAAATTNDIVFVFGNAFINGATQVSVAGNSIPLVQVVDEQLLLFMVPAGLSSGTVTVTTSQGSTTTTTQLLVY